MESDPRAKARGKIPPLLRSFVTHPGGDKGYGDRKKFASDIAKGVIKYTITAHVHRWRSVTHNSSVLIGLE